MGAGDELEKFRFPKTLGDQLRIIGMPLDEFFPTAPPFLIAIYCKHALSGFIFAVTIWIIIRWMKRGRGSMWLYNLLYWHIPTEFFRIVYKTIPDSSFRKWIK